MINLPEMIRTAIFDFNLKSKIIFLAIPLVGNICQINSLDIAPAEHTLSEDFFALGWRLHLNMCLKIRFPKIFPR